MRAQTHELQGLVPELRPWAQMLVDMIRSAGVGVTITSVYRDRKKQAKLYAAHLARVRAGVPGLPALPPGRSLHEHRIAWDMVTVPRSALREAGEIWESWGGQWGGRVNDPVHFQAKQLLRRPLRGR